MTTSKKRCPQCRKSFPTESMVRFGVQHFCNFEHAVAYANKKSTKAKGEKIKRADMRERKKSVMTRTEWFSRLQKLVNQYVKIRDRDEPCCTCGTKSETIKYDAGHFIAVKRGGVDPRRFELTNIHKQCSVNCNQFGSGMRAEYREFIRGKYGDEHLDWLECEKNHKSLKEQFPHWTDIENEIKRYRLDIRKLGEKPCV